MYSEQHPVQFGGGIHNGTLDALQSFAPHGLTLNGMDLTRPESWETLLTQHRDPNSQVSIEVNHPDPQAQRDIATIARHTIWNGKNLWPGRVLPPERFNQGANHLRKAEGLPQEGPMQIQGSADVSSDMSVLAKWNVISLGELQQPGGVGATQDYNPVVDGPNPDGPNFGDNAGNSAEQEVALQTWVNLAIDLMNRGEAPEGIVAQLAHDGCPNPEEVLQRAQQQPEHSQPVSDEIGQDPFDAPVTPDPSLNGEMQGLSQQPPVTTARVRIAGTTLTGTEIDRWEGLWGEGTVKVALDDGGTLDVSPDAIQPIDGTEAKHPVSEIQSFIDSMPKVEPTRPHIQARLQNLELVRRACRANIAKVAFSDQVKLQKIDSDAEAETAVLNEIISNYAEPFEVAYVKAQRRFAFNAFNVAEGDETPYIGHAKEAGAIWATENFEYAVENDDSYKAAAAHYASRLGLNGAEFQQFMAGADEHRIVRTDEFTATEPETTENEGPAEALFV